MSAERKEENIDDKPRISEFFLTSSLWIWLIRAIHLSFILFILFGSFSNDAEVLFLHAMIIPFLYIHWITNNNTCSLTTLERYLQKKIKGKVDDSSCFTCSVIEPIYELTNHNLSYNKVIYGTTGILWLHTLSKLDEKYKKGEIKSFKSLAFPYFYKD